ncbi:MAG: hypothetical protein MUP17_10105 [candidate division Zixibacteria bacterium]|nr:hypothetical protein [candidate division Zixibacteria bacterium]
MGIKTEQELKRVIEGILFDWIISEKPISNIAITKNIFGKVKEAGYVRLSPQQSKILETCSGHHL